ncbi:MAG TPA: RDD family protein [Anaeromyxobacteraceae bacterium]|nr:RDD family protein [Anaeromyxobacteraceae bacterium]
MQGEAQLRIETAERVALSLEVAGLGPRALAYLVDLFLVFLAWVTALLLYSVSGDLLRRLQALSAAGQILAVLTVFLSSWGWDVAWETLGRGQTPGKRALGLRVVRADGAPIGLVESLARNLLRAVEVPLGYAPAVLAVALGPRRQRLGDLVAGTLVVRERRYDLSRYGPPAAADPRFASLRGRAGALLTTAELERLLDFLRRRAELDPEPRARIAGLLAGALGARARLEPEDPEAFLEALAAHHADGGRP